jgi:Xaa-Pro aminopeptidase
LLKRLKNLQKELKRQGLDSALIWYSRDLFYYSGMVQPAWLAVTPDDYRLFVRAGFSRALAETFLPEEKLEPERNISAAFGFLDRAGAGPVTGTELDLNEPPFITAGNQDPVEASTVAAIEIHLLEPDGLVIKLEDMLHVGPEASEYLSLTPQQVFSVG